MASWEEGQRLVTLDNAIYSAAHEEVVCGKRTMRLLQFLVGPPNPDMTWFLASIAASEDNAEALRLIFNHQSSIDKKPLLFIAAENGSVRCMDVFDEFKVDFDSDLLILAMKGDKDRTLLLEKLVKLECDPRVPDVFDAALASRPEHLRFIVKAGNWNINTASGFPLEYAVTKGTWEGVKTCLELGAKISGHHIEAALKRREVAILDLLVNHLDEDQLHNLKPREKGWKEWTALGDPVPGHRNLEQPCSYCNTHFKEEVGETHVKCMCSHIHCLSCYEKTPPPLRLKCRVCGHAIFPSLFRLENMASD
jgi:hypothetical protein